MNARPWKPILILAVLALCVVAMYPPERKLKPGIDLAGGTTLVYTVQVPEGVNAKDEIEQAIEVLKERVDPSGTRNLVWRLQGGNRIEVQMALAPKKVTELRDAFQETEDLFAKLNLDRRQIDTIAKTQDAAERKKLIDKHAGDNESRQRLLTGLSDIYDAWQAAEAPYKEAEDVFNEAQQKVDRLPDDATKEQRDAAEMELAEAQKAVFAKAKALNDAKRRYNGRVTSLLSTNLRWEKVEGIVKRPSERVVDGKKTNPRQQAIDALKKDQPDYADAIDKVAEAWAAYDEVRGPFDDPNQLKALLRGSGVLEFRIAAQPGDVPQFEEDQYRTTLRESGPNSDRDRDWVWFEVHDLAQYAEKAADRAALERDPVGYFRGRSLVGAEEGRREDGTGGTGRYFLLLANTPAKAMTHGGDGPEWRLTGAERGVDGKGFPAVNFKLDSTGATLMGQLTGAHIEKPMAIVLDGRVRSSPYLQGRILGSGQITKSSGGGYDQEELSYLIRTLNAGALSAKLSPEPILEVTTSPQLGADHLNKGMVASIGALIAVAIFMMIYYFFTGAIANFALVANMVIILGVMALNQATWTLPGIAGIVLTIGMAVDANVLIFERIREELENKSDIETAIRVGYDKALSTILDANITTLITCLILGYTATADIKGFAVTLGIGICATLFTALFCTRTIFEYYVKWFRPKTIKMLPTVVTKIRDLLRPNIKWVNMRSRFFVVSSILVVAGLVLVFSRGADNLDIQFRGGTQVGFELGAEKVADDGDVTRKQLTMSEVRSRLDKAAEELAEIAELRVKEAEADIETAKTSLAAQEEELVKSEKALADAGDDLSDDEETQLEGAVEQAKARVAEAKLALERAEETLLTRKNQIGEAPSLAGDIAIVQTIGNTESRDGEIYASEFSVSTLATDATAVSNAIKATFRDQLDIQPKIAFIGVGEGVDAPPIDTPGLNEVVIPVTEPTLGALLPDYANRDEDISPFRGNVAIVLRDLSPAISDADIERRIRATRFDPRYENVGSHTVRVIGLDVAADQADAPAGETLYTAAVVLVSDEQTNYQTAPDTFTNASGLASIEWQIVRDALQRDISLRSVNSFSSQISGVMKQQAIVAIVLSLLAIVMYIWIRFGSIRYGLAAIVALVHDVSITLGLVAVGAYLAGGPIGNLLGLDPFRIDLAMIAAFMTIIGYSLNDTIVVFDRIRENRGRLATATADIINNSINQTISRTMLTSSTTFIAVLVLYLFGGPSIHGFAYAMIIGVMVGTYSSIAIASPFLLFGLKGSGGGSAGVTKEPSPKPVAPAAHAEPAA